MSQWFCKPETKTRYAVGVKIILVEGKLLNEVFYSTPPKIAATLLAIFELIQECVMSTDTFDIAKLSRAMILRTPWIYGLLSAGIKDNGVFVKAVY